MGFLVLSNQGKLNMSIKQNYLFIYLLKNYWVEYILLECHLTKIGSDEVFFKNSQEGGVVVVGDEAKLK